MQCEHRREQWRKKGLGCSSPPPGPDDGPYISLLGLAAFWLQSRVQGEMMKDIHLPPQDAQGNGEPSAAPLAFPNGRRLLAPKGTGALGTLRQPSAMDGEDLPARQGQAGKMRSPPSPTGSVSAHCLI